MNLDEASIPAIAALLGVGASMEPYRPRGAAVYRLSLHNASLNTDVTIILWPSLARVDMRVGDSAIVFKGVDEVLLYPGVEVMFRRTNPPASLFISVGGRFGMAV